MKRKTPVRKYHNGVGKKKNTNPNNLTGHREDPSVTINYNFKSGKHKLLTMKDIISSLSGH